MPSTTSHPVVPPIAGVEGQNDVAVDRPKSSIPVRPNRDEVEAGSMDDVEEVTSDAVHFVETYALMKTICCGALLVSLLTANCFQLRSVIRSEHEEETTVLVLLSISIGLLAILAFLLAFLGQKSIHFHDKKARRAARIMNDIAAFLGLLIVVSNVLLTAFIFPVKMSADGTELDATLAPRYDNGGLIAPTDAPVSPNVTGL